MPNSSSAEALDAIFKAYDVRGLCPGQLDPTLAEAIGAGFARFALEDSDGAVTKVLVARDMRPTGVELAAAFAAGAASQGVDVVDLGPSNCWRGNGNPGGSPPLSGNASTLGCP